MGQVQLGELGRAWKSKLILCLIQLSKHLCAKHLLFPEVSNCHSSILLCLLRMVFKVSLQSFCRVTQLSWPLPCTRGIKPQFNFLLLICLITFHSQTSQKNLERQRKISSSLTETINLIQATFKPGKNLLDIITKTCRYFK